jgi:hypothetical protein
LRSAWLDLDIVWTVSLITWACIAAALALKSAVVPT